MLPPVRLLQFEWLWANGSLELEQLLRFFQRNFDNKIFSLPSMTKLKIFCLFQESGFSHTNYVFASAQTPPPPTVLLNMISASVLRKPASTAPSDTLSPGDVGLRKDTLLMDLDKRQ